MIVMGSEGISHVARHVRQTLLPSAADAYVATDLRFTAMCLDLIAEDYDRAVDVLVADREEACGIFAAALLHLEGGLRDRIGARLASEAKDLRVRTLAGRADDDMRVLIELQGEIESCDLTGKAWATDLNARIWWFIENYADRRIYRSPV